MAASASGSRNVVAGWLTFWLCLFLPSVGAPESNAEIRSAVAQALYAASATSAADLRLADARITQQRRQIEGLRAMLVAASDREATTRARLQTELTEAQERYVQQLA